MVHLAYFLLFLVAMFVGYKIIATLRWLSVMNQSKKLLAMRQGTDFEDWISNTSVVILAGGSDQNNKAMWPFQERTLLQIVIDAALQAGIKDVVVTGNPAYFPLHRQADSRVHFYQGPSTMHDNMISGLRNTHNRQVVVTTCDLVFANGIAFFDFLRKCWETRDLVIGYGVGLARESIRLSPTKRPSSMSLWGNWGEEKLTGGNVVFALDRDVLIGMRWLISLLYKTRKSKILLAIILGPYIALRYMSAKNAPWVLSVAELEQVASLLTGVITRAVMVLPELTFDVDSEEDYEALLKEREVPISV